MKKCTVTLLDEVNAKITGLDFLIAQTLVNMFEYELPCYNIDGCVRLGKWNGKVSYFSLGDTVPLID